MITHNARTISMITKRPEKSVWAAINKICQGRP
jgi:hypothetical protein